MIDIEARLSELGHLLDLDDADLSAQVLATLEPGDRHAVGQRSRTSRWRPLVACAVFLVVAVGVAVAVPSTRDRVAGWLGLDRVRIERRDERPGPITPGASRDVPPSTSTLSPGNRDVLGERTVTVDAATVTIGELDGRLDDVVITKFVEATDDVVSFQIDGMPALWIEAPHDVVIERDGSYVAERVAASTLLWQDGDVLRRVEGFSSVDDAVAYVRSR